ncbi:MAG: hypothetical protein JAY71_19375 [Candidatus Thiodiazotropha weberae]|nr:hypothetical protein [Candidatus Thiodiazotropha weberae]
MKRPIPHYILAKAHVLGFEAAEAGKPAAPALNRECMNLCAEFSKGQPMGTSIPILKYFAKGHQDFLDIEAKRILMGE